MENSMQNSVYINSNDSSAFYKCATVLESQLNKLFLPSYHCHTAIMCIGTDRSTGDSLGPLVGYMLRNMRQYDNLTVYGSLNNPVHAKNLETTLDEIYKMHVNPFIIAVDACLGSSNHIGYITMSKGSLKPGASMKKDLPEVGDISIAGIVNLSGFMDFFILQNTRLSIVMKMAELISSTLKYVFWKRRNVVNTNTEMLFR